MAITSTVVKKFDGEAAAKLWGELNISEAVETVRQREESEDAVAFDTLLFEDEEMNAKLAEEAARMREKIRDLTGRIEENVNFSAVRRFCTPVERVFFNSLKTRMDELGAVERLLRQVETGGETELFIPLGDLILLFGPYSGKGREFWFGNESKETSCPPLVKYFVQERLNGGRSILNKEEWAKLSAAHLAPEQVQAFLIHAETALLWQAKQMGELPEGSYRFGMFLEPGLGAPWIKHSVPSAVKMPRRAMFLLGTEMLGLVDRVVNCDVRTAISTRELFYTALSEDMPEAESLRPLVPMVAKSLNTTLLDGLKWFSNLKFLGIDRMPEDYFQDGASIILDYVLNREPYQIETGEALMRYACLSLQEVQYILKMETKAGRVFCPDRFGGHDEFLNHRPLTEEDKASIVRTLAEELLRK